MVFSDGCSSEIVDRHALQIRLRGHAHDHETAAGLALDLNGVELRLHLLHLRLQLRRLLHHSKKIGHGLTT